MTTPTVSTPRRPPADRRRRSAAVEHDAAHAVTGLHEPVGLEPGICRSHGVDVDAELTGQIAHRRQRFARSDRAVGDEESDARVDLRRDSDARTRIDPKR